MQVEYFEFDKITGKILKCGSCPDTMLDIQRKKDKTTLIASGAALRDDIYEIDVKDNYSVIESLTKVKVAGSIVSVVQEEEVEVVDPVIPVEPVEPIIDIVIIEKVKPVVVDPIVEEPILP
jgi:hypothetical protein